LETLEPVTKNFKIKETDIDIEGVDDVTAFELDLGGIVFEMRKVVRQKHLDKKRPRSHSLDIANQVARKTKLKSDPDIVSMVQKAQDEYSANNANAGPSRTLRPRK
jgi:hypothetical protein